MTTIDLNCDMGEGFGAYDIGDDAQMLRIVTSANIACGFHAGDPNVMDRTLRLAAEHGVGAGAHPGFFDLSGFGRRQIRGDSPAEIERQIVYQIAALAGLAKAAGTRLRHVKLHGALANMATEERDLADATARAIRAIDPDLIFVVMPGLEIERAGERHGLRMAREIYADRAYAESGNLLSRRSPGAVIHDAEVAADRVLRMVESQAVWTVSGARLDVRIDTVCVHGDTPGAVHMATRIRERLEDAGYALRPMADIIGAAATPAGGLAPLQL